MKVKKQSKKKAETCDFCGGEVVEKRTTAEFHHKGKLVIVENVPVRVCTQCGEKYYDAKIWAELERTASSRTNVKREIKVPVKEFGLAG
ncbi:MAG: YgiT-type zinc finger protein [Candidatus Brocadiales bacterium]|nr:YgiT-type zinc finger protein [Candidatus Brocadiales bacterium]